MIASANSFYDIRQGSSPGPAMVREPMSAGTVSTDAIVAPSSSRPNDDNDELRRLGERIAELAARINSAEARMMTLIAEFDRRGGWKDGGYSSCAEWLAWRIGTKIGTARERVRTARALERLPQTADALKQGTISYAKVRALTRVATPEREAELLEFARAGSAAKLERTVRMWKKLSRDAELLAERALAAGFGSGESSARPEDESTAGSDSELSVASGTRAERYQVMVHCDAATIAAEGEPGRSDLDGIRVSYETYRSWIRRNA